MRLQPFARNNHHHHVCHTKRHGHSMLPPACPTSACTGRSEWTQRLHIDTTNNQVTEDSLDAIDQHAYDGSPIRSEGNAFLELARRWLIAVVEGVH